MSHKEDSNFIWRVSNSGDVDVSAHGNGSDYYAVYGTVRPVVELYKCAIDDSCNNNDIEKDIDSKSEDNKETEKLDINNNKNEPKTKCKCSKYIKKCIRVNYINWDGTCMCWLKYIYNN